MKAVIAESLSKFYTADIKAVNQASFSISAGEIFGFLGPNGSGKTTMVKLLNGMLAPTEGSCRVFDIDPRLNPEKVHRISGVVTEHAQMYDHLSGLENLIFYGSLFGIGTGDSQDRALELLKQLDLLAAKDQKLETYSTGMRQRLSLARAMIHRPSILFLDEPTSGLDPENTQSVNAMIKDMAAGSGTTVFLCTHQLRYAQELCTSYGFMDSGILFAGGTLSKLRKSASNRLTVRIQTDRFPLDITCSNIGEQFYQFHLSSTEEIPPLVERIVAAGGKIYHLSADELSLEEIYFLLLERQKGKGGAG